MSSSTKDIKYNFSATDTNVSSTVDKIGSSFSQLEGKVQTAVTKINSSATGMKNLATNSNKTGKDMLYLDSSLSSLATKLQKTQLTNELMNNSLKDIGTTTANTKTSFSNMGSQLADLRKNGNYNVESAKSLNKEYASLGKQVTTSEKSLASMGVTLKNLENTKRTMKESLVKATAEFGKQSPQVANLKGQYQSICGELNKTTQLYKQESVALEKLKSQQKSLGQSLSVYTNRAQQTKKATDATIAFRKETDSLYKKERVLHNSLKQTERAVQGKADTVKRTTDSMSNYGKKIDLVSENLKKATTNQKLTNENAQRFEKTIVSTNAKVDDYKNTIASLTRQKEALGQTINDKENDLVRLQATFAKNGAESKILQADIENLRASYDGLDSQLKQAEAGFEQMSNKSKELSNQFEQAKAKATTFGAKVQDVSTKMQAAAKAGMAFGQGVANFGNTVQQAGRGMMNLGNSMRWMTVAGTAVFGGAIKGGMDFEKAMADLAATLDTTELGVGGLSGAMDVLEEKVRSLAKTSIFNPTEVAEGMKYLSLAGYSTAETLSSIEPMLKMAQIGSLDLASATDLLTDSMASYRLEVSDMPKFLDVLAKLQSSSNTNIAQAAEAYIWAGGSLADYNVSLEDSASLIGILANQGLKGATAGRSLSSMLVNLSKDSGESAAALERLHKLTGKDVFAFNKDGSVKGTVEQIRTIKEALDSLDSEEERNKIIQGIAGKTQMKTFTKLLNQIGGEFSTLKSKVSNADGALDQMHQTVSQSSWAKFKEMLSAIQEALLNIWDTIQPLVMFVISKITEIANKFSELDQNQQLAILKILAMVAILPLLVKAFGAVVLGIGSFIKAIGLIIKAVMFVFNAIGFVVGAIATFGGAVMEAGGVFALFSGLAASAVSKVIGVFTGLVSFIGVVVGNIIGLFESIAIGVLYLGDAIGAIAGLLGLSAGAFLGWAAVIIAAIAWCVSAWRRGYDESASLLQNLGNMVKTLGQDIADFFIGVWNSIHGLIQKVTGKTQEEIESSKITTFKDKNAQDAGYKNYKDQKTQQKQQKKETKTETKFDTNLLDKTKDAFGELSKGLTLNIDDGGFFGEFSNFFGDYEEFAKSFQEDKKEMTFEARVEADVLEVIEAEDKLRELEEEYSEMELTLQLADQAIDYCDSQIQALLLKKNELMIDPKANEGEIAKIDSEIAKLTERREANLEIKAKGEEKLKEIDEAQKNLKDKRIEVLAKYKEEGKTKEVEKLLAQERLYRDFEIRMVTNNLDGDLQYAKDRVKALPDEIGELEKKIAVEQDPEKRAALISELTALQQEKIILEMSIEYNEALQAFEKIQTEKDKIQSNIDDLNKELAGIEWVSKNGQQLTEQQKARQKEITGELKEQKSKLSELNKEQQSVKKTLDSFSDDKISKMTEYFNNLAEKTTPVKEGMEQAAEGAEKLNESLGKLSFDDFLKDKDIFSTTAEGLGSISEKAEEVQEKLGEGMEVKVETENAITGLDNISTKAGEGKQAIDDMANSLNGLSTTTQTLSVDTLKSGLSECSSLVDTISQKLSTLGSTASSSLTSAFSSATQVLLSQLEAARGKMLSVANVASNYGVSAMKAMGNALSTSLEGARGKIMSVANVARNYGVSAMKAMGDALCNSLSRARGIVASIASAASSIKINVPVTGGSGGGGRSLGRSLMTASVSSYSIPSIGLRNSDAISSNYNTNNTNTTNSFNFNIEKVAMDKGTDIKQTAKQFTIMCQREGIFK